MYKDIKKGKNIEAFTKYIKYFIDDSKIFTRKSLAKLCGVSEVTVLYWVEGECIPTPARLMQLIKVVLETPNKSEECEKKLESFLKLLDVKLTSNEKRCFKKSNTIGVYCFKSEIGILSKSIEELPFLVKIGVLESFVRITKDINIDIGSGSDISKVEKRIQDLSY